MGLPCEIWHQHIFRSCNGVLPWASVCQSWQSLVCGGVTRFTPRLLPYSDRLYKSLTISYLAQFTRLRALYLDTGYMRVASVIPAIASMTQMKTLALSRGGVSAKQFTKLTNLTALDLTHSQYIGDGSLLSMTQLRMLVVARMVNHIAEQLPSLTNLTFLDAAQSHGCIAKETLSPLTSLQYLSLQMSDVESFQFLTSLTSLTFLNLDRCRSLAKDSPPLLTLTELKALSIDNVAVPTETILKMTQLRLLGISSSIEGSFGLETIDDTMLQKLNHCSLYYTPVILGNNVPPRVIELGIEHSKSIAKIVMTTFKGWHYPLHSRYFNTSVNRVSWFI